ncbi:MAG TPA: kazal domain protein, partial [Tistrella mobilis]|nr:kazal domain protein [Tistrella mobilis]
MRHWIIIIAFFLVACEDTAEKICIDESKINPDGICPEVWDPVLGCDEKIYSN